MYEDSSFSTFSPTIAIVYLLIIAIPVGMKWYLIVVCFFFINLFIYLWLCWVLVAAHGLSLVAASGGYSSLRCAGFSLRCLLCCGAQALGARASVVVACRLSSCGSWALERKLSSWGTWA